eukprot:7102602-Pyramimonas_sp.AAC.2
MLLWYTPHEHDVRETATKRRERVRSRVSAERSACRESRQNAHRPFVLCAMISSWSCVLRLAPKIY